MQSIETLLLDAGLALAIEPLRIMFEREGLYNPLVQSELAREVVERTAQALTIFTKPRVVH